MKQPWDLTFDEKLELEEIRQEIEEQNPSFTKEGIIGLAWNEFLKRNAGKNIGKAIKEIKTLYNIKL